MYELHYPRIALYEKRKLTNERLSEYVWNIIPYLERLKWSNIIPYHVLVSAPISLQAVGYVTSWPNALYSALALLLGNHLLGNWWVIFWFGLPKGWGSGWAMHWPQFYVIMFPNHFTFLFFCKFFRLRFSNGIPFWLKICSKTFLWVCYMV